MMNAPFRKNGSSRWVIPKVQVIFPSVWRKEVFHGEETGKYACTLLIPQSKQEMLSDLLRDVEKMAREKFGDPLPARVTFPFRDGNAMETEWGKGCVVVRASSSTHVPVYDEHINIVKEEDGLVYSGVLMNVAIHFWAMDNRYGKRVVCELDGLQFSAHGEPLGWTEVRDDFAAFAAETTKPETASPPAVERPAPMLHPSKLNVAQVVQPAWSQEILKNASFQHQEPAKAYAEAKGNEFLAGVKFEGTAGIDNGSNGSGFPSQQR